MFNADDAADSRDLISLDWSSERPSCYGTAKLGYTLDTGRIYLAQRLLHEQLELVPTENFAWLLELQDLGCSTEEIAEVLMNEE